MIDLAKLRALAVEIRSAAPGLHSYVSVHGVPLDQLAAAGNATSFTSEDGTEAWTMARVDDGTVTLYSERRPAEKVAA